MICSNIHHCKWMVNCWFLKEVQRDLLTSCFKGRHETTEIWPLILHCKYYDWVCVLNGLNWRLFFLASVQWSWLRWWATWVQGRWSTSIVRTAVSTSWSWTHVCKWNTPALRWWLTSTCPLPSSRYCINSQHCVCVCVVFNWNILNCICLTGIF